LNIALERVISPCRDRGEAMSLIRCEECGKAISDSARACPNCGFPRTYSLTTWIVWIAFAGGAAYVLHSASGERGPAQTDVKTAVVADKKPPPPQPAPRTAPKTQPVKAKPVDPVQRAVTGAKILRQSIHDPEAADLQSALVVEGGGAVCYEYLLRNREGAGAERAVLSPTGKLLLSATGGFSDLWERECQGRKGVQAVAQVNWPSP
jgi:hypothetical protein